MRVFISLVRTKSRRDAMHIVANSKDIGVHTETCLSLFGCLSFKANGTPHDGNAWHFVSGLLLISKLYICMLDPFYKTNNSCFKACALVILLAFG